MKKLTREEKEARRSKRNFRITLVSLAGVSALFFNGVGGIEAYHNAARAEKVPVTSFGVRSRVGSTSWFRDVVRESRAIHDKNCLRRRLADEICGPNKATDRPSAGFAQRTVFMWETGMRRGFHDAVRTLQYPGIRAGAYLGGKAALRLG